MDRNGDGIINDGKELFGNDTILKNGNRAANGFQALAELDENKDGKIDQNDTAFAQMRVWQDWDRDGCSCATELHALEEFGIQSINCYSTITNFTDESGNNQARRGSFEWIDGTTGEVGDYNLQQDATYAVANQWLSVSEDIAALPDLRGYGSVYDLHQTMRAGHKWAIEVIG